MITSGTDFAGAFLAGNPTLPVHRGQMQCRELGAAVFAYGEPDASGRGPRADQTLVLTNGRIHTMDARNTVATSVAIRHGRFVAVGGRGRFKFKGLVPRARPWPASAQPVARRSRRASSAACRRSIAAGRASLKAPILGVMMLSEKPTQKMPISHSSSS